MTTQSELRHRAAIRPLGIAVMLIALTLGLTGPAQAAEPTGPLFDRFSVKVSGKFANLDTTVRVSDPDTILPGTEIDFESDLGLGDSELLSDFQFQMLLGRRHRLTFLFDRNDRSGVRTIAKEIRFEDVVFPVNAELESSFTSQNLGIGYTYFFKRKERTAIGATLALVVGSYESTLRGVGQLEDDLINIEASADTSFPQPQIGLEVRQMIGEKWRLIASASGLAIKLDDGGGGEFDGNLFNARASIEHLTFKHASFGAGFSLNTLNASFIDGEDMQEIDSKSAGGEIFVRFRAP